MGGDRAVTVVSVRQNTYLEKSKVIFMWLCVITCSLMNIFSRLLLGKCESSYSDGMVLKLVLCLAFYVTAFIKLREAFIEYNMGYDMEGVWTAGYNIILLFGFTELYYIVSKSFGISSVMYLLIVVVTLLVSCFKLYSKRDAILTFKVRERGSRHIGGNDGLIDGENDIKLILKDGTEEVINIFKEKMYIIENNNILVLSNKGNKTYDKSFIDRVDIDNKKGTHYILKYDEALDKWGSL